MNEELSSQEASRCLDESFIEIIFKDVLNTLLKLPYSFQTGSRYWCNGVAATSESDYDVCVLEESRADVEAIFHKYSLTFNPASYNNGIKCNINGIIINVIFLSRHSLSSWKITTDIMEYIVQKFKIVQKKKWVRVQTFETIVALIKMLYHLNI